MKKYFKYLLSDESFGISFEDYEERKKIAEQLKGEFSIGDLGKIRHFQPQIGCLNACSICSKHASSNVSWWKEERIRNVVAAIKSISKEYRDKKPYISWDRDNHRSGVIFSYLDNDIGNYYYLDKFINLLYDELGVGTRISTVGYSRHNEFLNQMHKEINKSENLKKLAGFRISFTPYAIGWKCNNKYYSRNDYIADITNILKIYRKYYKFAGSGNRKMCVELRYKPLVILDEVIQKEIDGHMIISCNNHIYISKDKDVKFNVSYISNPYDHTITLSEKPIYFYDILIDNAHENINSKVKDFLEKSDENDSTIYPVYMLENSDGYYYSIDPSISEDGNYGVNIYPKTENRINSGVIITERFALNSIIRIKHLNGIKSLEKFENASWENVYDVMEELDKMAKNYNLTGQYEKEEYIISEVIPMLEGYICALQDAGYSPKDFFDHDFSIDTGIICNLGSALKEFKGITFLENEPLTPTHERNYGKHNSTMTKEKTVLRISCDYDNQLLIQKLNLSKTATREGQVEFSKTIKLTKQDDEYNMSDLKTEYLIPGQRRR